MPSLAEDKAATPRAGSERQAAWQAVLVFLQRHWRAIGRIAALGLVLVVVLQNVEPTGVDLLFWSIQGVPKLVLMVVCLVLGAGLWEIARRRLGVGAGDDLERGRTQEGRG